MVYILRSVLMGLHRFAPPSDKAELDASAAGSQEWRYLWAYLWPQTFSAFSSTCIEKNPTHNLWHYNTDKKKNLAHQCHPCWRSPALNVLDRHPVRECLRSGR